MWRTASTLLTLLGYLLPQGIWLFDNEVTYFGYATERLLGRLALCGVSFLLCLVGMCLAQMQHAPRGAFRGRMIVGSIGCLMAVVYAMLSLSQFNGLGPR